MFTPVERCWVCGGTTLVAFHQCRLDFQQYAAQDPELHAYSGHRIWLVRCASCGFGQPQQLPALPRFFDRMYDQRWSAEWVANEFDAEYKDFIFRTILRELGRRVAPSARRLLDVGAHAGRFMHLARQAGWQAEGIELNPRTASYAARRTGATVHQINADALQADGRQYSAVTLTDVLEHIPDPLSLLRVLAGLVEPGGSIAIKVPCGRSQHVKERVCSIFSGEMSLAENLVHVSHFSPRSLRLALERAGFTRIAVQAGAPELLQPPVGVVRRALSNAGRLAVYAVAAAPGGVHTPLALHLQAFATLGVRPSNG
jgi:2-polyprenyl-3-methyl-5-hydroxy-6-metoxy-1,4-benzoquinol methylase